TSVNMENFRADFPTLIVNGDLSLHLQSKTRDLRESDYSMNFNPAGASYQGVSDNDRVDFYPNRIDGLVHVLGNLATTNSALIDGGVVCHGTAFLQGDIEIRHD